MMDNDAMPDLGGVTICQVIPTLETGGAERTTLEIAAGIVAAGARSLVVSSGGPMVAELEAGGSRHVTLPAASKNPMVIAANARALRDLIRSERIDILHARSRAPAWSALRAARAEGIHFVTTYHGIYRAKGHFKRLYNSVMARGDAVIANSRYTADAVHLTYGEADWFPSPDRFVTIPRGADLDRFDPDRLTDRRRDAARLAFGGEHAFRVLLPGRLTSWKGQNDLLDAVIAMRAEAPGRALRVVMVGSAQGRDAYETELRSRVEAEGLADIVHIHGHWDDMPAAYDWADVAVSASTRPEAFGRVAVEAQAMACPVVATAHGGALETVEDGVTGLLVPPGHPASLAEALTRIAGMSIEARGDIGAAGRTRIIRHFSTQAMTSATLRVYKSLMAREGSI